MTMYCSRETRSSTPFNDSIAGSSRRSSRQKCDSSLSICRLEMEKKEPLLYYSDSLPLLVKTMNKSSNGTSRTIHLKDFPSLTGIKRNGRGRRRRIEDSIFTSSLCSMAIDVPLKIEPLPNEMPLEVLFIQEEREKDDWDLFPREGIEHRKSSYLRTSIPTSTSVERVSSLITEHFKVSLSSVESELRFLDPALGTWGFVEGDDLSVLMMSCHQLDKPLQAVFTAQRKPFASYSSIPLERTERVVLKEDSSVELAAVSFSLSLMLQPDEKYHQETLPFHSKLPSLRKTPLLRQEKQLLFAQILEDKLIATRW